MTERIDKLILAMGRVEGIVEAILRRMDASEAHFMSHILHLDRKIKRNGNGNGTSIKIPYAKIATFLGLIILGALMHMSPDAVKASIVRMLVNQIGG